MTKYPKVEDRIKEYFGKAPLKLADSMQSVSRGASIYHYYDIENIKSETEYTVIPKLPQTIYLNVRNGFPIALIEANTKAGTPVVHENLIEVTSETGVSLELYAGMKFYDPQLKKLQNLHLDFPQGIKVGSKISLKLEYTEKGMLLFEAWVEGREDISIDTSIEGLELKDEEIKNIDAGFGISEVRGLL